MNKGLELSMALDSALNNAMNDPGLEPVIYIERDPGDESRALGVTLICPTCGTKDDFIEKDVAIRHNRIEFHTEGEKVWGDVVQEDSDFSTLNYACNACHQTINMVAIDDIQWS